MPAVAWRDIVIGDEYGRLSASSPVDGSTRRLVVGQKVEGGIGEFEKM